MKNQRIRVKTRPAPPRRAPTFGPAAALRPAPPPRRLASSPPPPRRRPGETPDATFFSRRFFSSPRTRLPRLGRFPSPPGTGEPAGTGGDEEANLPFRDRAYRDAAGAAGARVSPYGYLVRTRTETRAARRRDRRARTARRTTRRRAGGAGRDAVGRSEIVRFVTRYERLRFNASRVANERRSRRIQMLGSIVFFFSFLRSFSLGLRLRRVDARVFCFVLSDPKLRRRNDVARHRLAADGGRDRPGCRGCRSFLAFLAFSGAAETETRSYAKRAAGDARGERETRGGGVVIPKKLTSGGRRRGVGAGEESGGESAGSTARCVIRNIIRKIAFAVFRRRGRSVASARGAHPLARSFARRRFDHFKRASSHRRLRRRSRRRRRQRAFV